MFETLIDRIGCNDSISTFAARLTGVAEPVVGDDVVRDLCDVRDVRAGRWAGHSGHPAVVIAAHV